MKTIISQQVQYDEFYGTKQPQITKEDIKKEIVEKLAKYLGPANLGFSWNGDALTVRWRADVPGGTTSVSCPIVESDEEFTATCQNYMAGYESIPFTIPKTGNVSRLVDDLVNEIVTQYRTKRKRKTDNDMRRKSFQIKGNQAVVTGNPKQLRALESAWHDIYTDISLRN